MNTATVEPQVKKEKHRTLFVSEIVWYSIFAVIWITGLVLAILGVCAYNVGNLSTNPLYSAQKGLAAAFGGSGVADFRLVGTGFMVVGMIGFLIAIYAYSSKASEKDAQQKRYEERMRILMADDTSKSVEVPANKPTDKVSK